MSGVMEDLERVIMPCRGEGGDEGELIRGRSKRRGYTIQVNG
jgi:hypothetical protein